ncbi:hypothetical protein HZ994_00795 [Akkermansiaceae bacterium]|nr:hypothetical protein HZ994_00795 [Akkermansiaceae bacterium]
MKTIKKLVAILGFMTAICLGSEEIPLPLASADIKGWIEVAGGVRIQIESPKGSIDTVKITAFGREIEIPESEMAKIKHMIYSKVSISHEGGYKQLGGHTIYFDLSFRDMFGGDPFEGDPMMEERLRIAVPESAPVKVTRTRVAVKE